MTENPLKENCRKFAPELQSERMAKHISRCCRLFCRYLEDG